MQHCYPHADRQVKSSHKRISRWLELVLCSTLSLPITLLATPSTPTSDFTVNRDGTVTHNKTALIWKRCAEGQTVRNLDNGISCSGTPTSFAWEEASQLNSDFAGYADWRLPTIAELQTIIEWERSSSPTINTAIFPINLNVQNGYYLSATLLADEDSWAAWGVDFTE